MENIKLILSDLTGEIGWHVSSAWHYYSPPIFTSAYERPLFWFGAYFAFRYIRLIVHLIAFWCYEPTPVPENPTLTSQDCSVILPTVDPANNEFIHCLESCLVNRPKEIFIVVVGMEKYASCKYLINKYTEACSDTKITILTAQQANKRTQVALGIRKVKTKITVLLDDHVLWGHKFLPTALAPFEDPQIGAVGTNKRVRKEHTGFNVLSYWNMLGAIYLERHNFEIRATNIIDGGVFVISGRTSLHRTVILQDKDFLPGFTNERFFFGLCGPLNPDDDNYITRFEVSRGWGIKIQYSDDACIETTLGAYPKFVQQCLRWVRTTWRSNSASLITDRTVYRSQPWCVYAVYITSFFNFALFNDVGLAYLLRASGYGTLWTYLALGTWIFATKMVKLWAYFQRHPEDLRMLPGYFAFAYFHSLIKLYAGFTFWNCHWGGRDLAGINRAAGGGTSTSSRQHSLSSRPGSSSSSGSSRYSNVPPAKEAMNTTGEGHFTPIDQASPGPQVDSKSATPSPQTSQARESSAPAPASQPAGIVEYIPSSDSTTPEETQSLTTPPKLQTDPKTPPAPSPTTRLGTSGDLPQENVSIGPREGPITFSPPANIEDYHRHGPPPTSTRLQSSSGPSISSTNEPSSTTSNPTNLQRQHPASNKDFTEDEIPGFGASSLFTVYTPTSAAKIKAQLSAATPAPSPYTTAAACKHCLEHRLLAILLIVIWLGTCVVHYMIAKLYQLPLGSGVGSSTTDSYQPQQALPQDWARGFTPVPQLQQNPMAGKLVAAATTAVRTNDRFERNWAW